MATELTAQERELAATTLDVLIREKLAAEDAAQAAFEAEHGPMTPREVLVWTLSRIAARQIDRQMAERATALREELDGLTRECLDYTNGDEDAARAMAAAEIAEGSRVDVTRLDREMAEERARVAALPPLVAADDLPY